MNQFTSIKVQGFRRLKDFSLSLRPFNVLVGENGVGKTTLLDIFNLLSAAAKGGLADHISRLGGISSVLSFGEARKLSISAEYVWRDDAGKDIYQYAISFRGDIGGSYRIVAEHLDLESGEDQAIKLFNRINNDINYSDFESEGVVRKVSWPINYIEAMISQCPKNDFHAEAFRSCLASFSSVHELDVSIRAPVRLPQQMAPASFPGEDGEWLASFLYSLKETNDPAFEKVSDALRAAFPTFERLEFPPVAAGLIALAWREKGRKTPFYANQLSEGTLRFLWLAALLAKPKSAITLIDEPEVSMHPEMLSLLVGLMREASQQTQLIVVTHSDTLVRFLEPDELVVFEMDEAGCATAKRGSECDVEDWLADYSLGELWKMGRLGGRV